MAGGRSGRPTPQSPSGDSSPSRRAFGYKLHWFIGSLSGRGGCSRQRRYEFSGEFRKTADFGRFNLWRPTVVDRTRGSNRQSALPTGRSNVWRLIVVDRTRGSNRVRVLPGENSDLWLQNSCQEPAVASGSRPCPADSLENCQGEGGCSRQRRPTIRKESCGFEEFGNSNLWFPNSCREPAAASGSGHCPPGCAVRAAMEAGELTPERYRAYLKLRAEIRRAQDAQAALAAKNEKFKQIARINRKKGAK